MTGNRKTLRNARTPEGVKRNARATAWKPNPVLWIVALTIIVFGLVATVGIVIPATTPLERQARDELEVITLAFEKYRADLGDWPSHACQPSNAFSSAYLAGYSCLYDNVYENRRWRGPYVCHVIPSDAVAVEARPAQRVDPIDPWGRCYLVYRFDCGGRIAILCSGPDGVVNTTLDCIRDGAPTGDDLIAVTAGDGRPWYGRNR